MKNKIYALLAGIGLFIVGLFTFSMWKNKKDELDNNNTNNAVANAQGKIEVLTDLQAQEAATQTTTQQQAQAEKDKVITNEELVNWFDSRYKSN